MIGRLRGELVEIHGCLAVIDVGGVGYEIQLPESVLVRLPKLGETVTLVVRQVFREDGVALYGFFDAFQRRLFDLLTEVKGCGPKIALSALGQLGESALTTAILQGDTRSLARANGIGQRLAERIALELKDKIAEESAMQRIAAAVSGGTNRMAAPDRLVEALLALGYKRHEAEQAASEVPDDVLDLEDQIRTALRTLSR